MMKERIRLQNMCCTGEDWNVDLNRFLPWTCVNFFVHRNPQSFESEKAWKEHRVKCAGPVASTSKSGRGRGRHSKAHHNN